MEFSSDSLQICYIDSLYQYVGVYKLIYFIIFFIFCVLSLFLLRKIWPGKMLKFLIKSCFLWSSHQNLFKFATWIHCIILISMLVFTSWYIFIIFFIFWSFYRDCFYLEKYDLELNRVSFPMKFSSESFQIYYIYSLYHAHQYLGNYLLMYFIISAFLSVFSVFLLKKLVLGI